MIALENTQPKGLQVYGRENRLHIGGYRLTRGDFKKLVEEGNAFWKSVDESRKQAKPERPKDAGSRKGSTEGADPA